MNENDDYRAHIAHNKEILLERARALGVTINLRDLDDINASQLLLDMACSEDFLDALQAHLFTISDVKAIYRAFMTYYANNGVNNAQIAPMAEQQMGCWLRNLDASGCLESLEDEVCGIGYVRIQAERHGPKLIWLLDRDFIEALNAGRIGDENIAGMSEDELKYALDSDSYPLDQRSAPQ